MYKVSILFLLLSFILCSCGKNNTESAGVKPAVIASMKALASKDGFKPFDGNPVISPGSPGSWDAGALGSMTVLRVGEIFHLYYEAWGVRSEQEWDASEYETLQIGHATSKDGIHWTKDEQNPVLPHGGEADFDRTGVWDPYVIYEDGLFKMWYGGGGGSQPNFGWASATSIDGSHFEKQGLIGIGNQTGTEDCHVVFDKESGLYYMYYWYGWEEPEAMYLVTSPTETGFDFNKAIKIRIEGDDSYMCKFGHILRDTDGWHMFYSNFVRPHCPNSIVRYAYSEDGIHWQAKNKWLIFGLDADVLQVTDDLYLMAYGPKNHFDKKDADIRVAIYNGSLMGLASKPTYVDIKKPASIAGKKFTIELGEDGLHTFYFKPDGEVIITDEDDQEGYTFNAYYDHEEDIVHIMGENLDIKGIYDGKTLRLKE
jgi:hypothetical protein